MNLYFSVFLFGVAGAWLTMKFGSRLGINDIPNHRSSHNKSVPKGAGVGILASILVVCWTLSIKPGFWIPVLVISIISFWGGDRHRLSPEKRVLIQFLCSLFFVIHISIQREITGYQLLILIPMTVFNVGTSNFYNFMDGIDGIAGIVGMVSFTLLALYAYINNLFDPWGNLSICIAISCVGFLIFNLPKAKVFLGDIGSVCLGFTFSCMVIIFSRNLNEFILLVGFLAMFYIDEFVSIVYRTYKKESLIKPHREHLYQLLANEMKIEHWKISIFYGFVQLIFGLSAIYLSFKGIVPLLIMYIFFSIFFLIFSIVVYQKAIPK